MRLQDVEDDAHPILIVISDDALVCVGCICSDNSILLVGTLTLINRYLDCGCTLNGCPHFTLIRIIDWVVHEILSHLPFLVDDGSDQGVLLQLACSHVMEDLLSHLSLLFRISALYLCVTHTECLAFALSGVGVGRFREQSVVIPDRGLGCSHTLGQ